jgi:transposase
MSHKFPESKPSLYRCSANWVETCRSGRLPHILLPGWGYYPDNDISGGRVLWRGVRKIKNRAGQLFRLAAHSLHRSLAPMGIYLQRMKARLGPAAATTATAHKVAILFYTLVRRKVEYDESVWTATDAERQKRRETKLKRQAIQLAYQLVPIEQHPAA